MKREAASGLEDAPDAWHLWYHPLFKWCGFCGIDVILNRFAELPNAGAEGAGLHHPLSTHPRSPLRPTERSGREGRVKERQGGEGRGKEIGGGGGMEQSRNTVRRGGPPLLAVPSLFSVVLVFQ